MSDISKTRDDLIERAAANLGLVQPGESLADEDYDTLDHLVDPLIAQLNADRIAYIQDAGSSDTENSGSIPVEVFLPLASLLANHAGPSFGSPINDAALMRDQATLRRINSNDPTYETLKSVYY